MKPGMIYLFWRRSAKALRPTELEIILAERAEKLLLEEDSERLMPRAGVWWALIGWLVLAALGLTSCLTRQAVVEAMLPAGGDPAGITDPNLIVPQAPWGNPAVGTWQTEPAFGTSLRRLSDLADGFESHIYSQLQAFSADNHYVLLAGSAGYVIRRLSDLAPVALDTAAWNAPRWQPAAPHTIVHYDSNEDTTVRVQYSQLDSLQTNTIFTFPAQYQYIRSNQSFDELSRDGQWTAGMVSREDGAMVIFALNLQTATLGAILPLPDLYSGPCQPDPQWGQLEPDWVGVSPLGRYLVVQWPRDGLARCSGLETFDLESGVFTGRVSDSHQHGDLGLLPDGQTEIFVTFEIYHPSGQLAIAYRLLPGEATVSQPVYLQTLDWMAAHISCQGPAGVCLVTTEADPSNGWQALEGEIYLLYSDGSVRRLSHHRTSNCGYWVQPRASLSADGRYAIFASDWGQASCGGNFPLGQGDPYLVEWNMPVFIGSDFVYLPIIP